MRSKTQKKIQIVLDIFKYMVSVKILKKENANLGVK